ncbi:ATP-binding protein [Actinoallomurus sp. CA-150999]|uniref:ATP-binding protein n=1 Tax=Actinoallomurus sp. CA-150999 TaxID=3239887 RepID=UPI003D8D2B33
MEATYLARIVDPLIAELMTEVPAVSLIGPRAAGKTTTALRHAASVVHLDRPGDATVFRIDPDAALRGLPEPVLLDEWQEAPEVLGAVKRNVDADPRPGRYILTGSVRAELDAHTWPGTGRVIHVRMTGLTARERFGDATEKPFIDRIVRPGSLDLRLPESCPDTRDYVDLALSGTFPEPALRLSARGRRRWFDSYVQQLLTRDVAAVEPRRDPERLRRFFEALALNTAGVVDSATLYRAAGINIKTANAYENLLSNVFVLDVVPAWFSNRLKRLAQGPKRYLIDAALLGAAVGADTETVLRDPDLLGRLIDTFVAEQLRAELAVSDHRPRMHHLRQEGGRREIDILIELAGHRVIGIEVKASTGPNRDSGRHLAWLRDELGDRFVHGLVLHTGRHIYELGDRITAAPICTLWA